MTSRLIALISVIICSLIVTTVCDYWFDNSCPRRGETCKCVNQTRDHLGTYWSIFRGVKCCCIGSNVTSVPQHFSSKLDTLILHSVDIAEIRATDFERYRQLQQIDISYAKKLLYVDGEAFAHLTELRKISIIECNRLEEIRGTLLHSNSKIKILSVTNNGLRRLPNLQMTDSHMLPMDLIDFSNNQIQYLGHGQIDRVYATSLRLHSNQLHEIGDYVFKNCKFVHLDLSKNEKLKIISTEGFGKISAISNLDLSETSISELPTSGIKELKILKVQKTYSLKKLPSILAFASLKEAHFTYPYHCCLFKHAKRETARPDRQYLTNLKDMQRRYNCKTSSAAPHSQTTIMHTAKTILSQNDKRRRIRGISQSKFANHDDQLANWYWGAMDLNKTSREGSEAGAIIWPTPVPRQLLGAQVILDCVLQKGLFSYYENITCTPQPDALNPCEDIIAYPWLRVIIWFVWTMAIVGNIGVWLVLLAVRHHRMRVHYFFMINLAFADLLIGVYLGMLAIEDILTSGEYYNHAVQWQTGSWCHLAGFISVFASELSIIIMFLISFEIWYNTKYIFYGKRLKLSSACALTVIAYLFSTFMASLPLIGVSGYSQSSICLPLKVDSFLDRAYLIAGLSLNCLLFFGMASNYALIYYTVSGSASPSTRVEDIQVAKKMAFLIGTDFICWAPTIFFGLTAALHLPLISISVAKIFLVIFYPINAFANPFLYVYFTKAIRGDMKVMAKNNSMLQRLAKPASSSRNLFRTSTFNHFYDFVSSNGNSPRGSVLRHKMTGLSQTTYLSTPRSSNCSSQRKGSAEMQHEHSVRHSLTVPSIEFGQSQSLLLNRDDVHPSTAGRVTFTNQPIEHETSFNNSEQLMVEEGGTGTKLLPVNLSGLMNKKTKPIGAGKHLRVSLAPKMSDIKEQSNSQSSNETDSCRQSPRHWSYGEADGVLRRRGILKPRASLFQSSSRRAKNAEENALASENEIHDAISGCEQQIALNKYQNGPSTKCLTDCEDSCCPSTIKKQKCTCCDWQNLSENESSAASSLESGYSGWQGRERASSMPPWAN